MNNTSINTFSKNHMDKSGRGRITQLRDSGAFTLLFNFMEKINLVSKQTNGRASYI
jgi:hypothetical protein